MQTTIDTIRTTSATLNHGERKIVKTHSRSRTSTSAGPEQRVVPRVEVVQRGRVVRRRAQREVGDLADRHPDHRHQCQEDDLGDGEVDRREQAPQPVPEPGGQAAAGRSGGGRPGDLAARDGSSLLDGAERRDGPRGVLDGVGQVGLQVLDVLEPDRHPEQARRDARRPSSSASVDWRCDVDGGWTTIVWTLPSEAVSSGRLEPVDDRPPAARPPSTSNASIPPATPGRNWRPATSCWGGWARPG